MESSNWEYINGTFRGSSVTNWGLYIYNELSVYPYSFFIYRLIVFNYHVVDLVKYTKSRSIIQSRRRNFLSSNNEGWPKIEFVTIERREPRGEANMHTQKSWENWKFQAEINEM
jgi:hypothetical protein